jgi:hypothetical protein
MSAEKRTDTTAIDKFHDFEELLAEIQNRANAGTLTRQQQADIAVKYKDDPVAIARIANAVVPNNVHIPEGWQTEPIDIDTLY